MPRPAKSEDLPEFENLLVVEGIDDLYVIANLCKANQIEPEQFFHIHKWKGQAGGYSEVSRYVPLLIKAENQKRIGIVVDADIQLADRWVSLRNLLSKAGYTTVPEQLPPEGLILFPEISDTEVQERSDHPIIGVWIMPDNTLPGALENFVQWLVPPERTSLWDHAEASVAYLPTKPTPLTDNWLAKARIHAYLAWQEEPGKPMGVAITSRYLVGDTGAAQPFLDWLRRLFEIP